MCNGTAKCASFAHASIVLYFLYCAVLIVEEALYLQRTKMCDVVRRDTVVIEQIPLSLVLYNTVVGCPANNRIEDNSLISERTVWVVTRGVAQEVTVTSRVREVVLTVLLMHP